MADTFTILTLLGRRVLLTLGSSRYASVNEYFVLESSPSGNYVRLQDENGHKQWVSANNCGVVEELPPAAGRSKYKPSAVVSDTQMLIERHDFKRLTAVLQCARLVVTSFDAGDCGALVLNTLRDAVRNYTVLVSDRSDTETKT